MSHVTIILGIMASRSRRTEHSTILRLMAVDHCITTTGTYSFTLNPNHSVSFSFPPCRPRWSRGYHTHHWIRGSRVQTRPGSVDFSERKNPEYDFLRKGSKAKGPVSCWHHCKGGVATFKENDLTVVFGKR